MRTDLAIKKQQIIAEMYKGFLPGRASRAEKNSIIQYKTTLKAFCRAARPTRSDLDAAGVSSKEEYFILTYGMSPQEISNLKTNRNKNTSMTTESPANANVTASSEKFCTKCGTKAAPGQKFCGNCGNPLNE